MKDEASARVPLLEREQVSETERALFDQLLEIRGVVPNMFKALANVPGLGPGIAALLKPLMADGALPARFKELVATYVAALNDCDYCVSAHRHLARKRGATEQQIEALGRIGGATDESLPFTPKELAGLRHAALVSRSGNAASDEDFQLLASHFSDGEIVELTVVIAAFAMFPRINSSLRIPVTPIPDAL